jgi:formate-dependent nitrite reductase membrane component NrfD
MILGYLVVVVGKNGAHLLYLGRPERFWRAAMRPDRSWIARGIWASGLFALSGGILLLPAILGPEWQATATITTAAKAVVIVSGLFIMFYDGFVMNHSAAIPFWNTQLLPLLIFMYATLGGATLTITVSALQGYENRATAWLEKAESYLLIANFLLLCVYLFRMSRWTPAAQETVRGWVKGRYARVFFGLIVAVGLIATLMLSLAQKQWQAQGFSLVIGGCELTGDFSLLMLMLRSGLFSPQTAPGFGTRGRS